MFSTFDYFLQDKLKMQMVGMIHMQFDTPLGASKIVADGWISLK